MSGTEKKKSSKMPEFLRKFFVSLKRRPQNIPLVVFGAAYLLYSLNLTYVSHTTSRIQGSGMGLCGFVTMLFSTLAFVCFLNSFPRRKKPNVPMILLMFAMLGIVIFCDIRYRALIWTALSRETNTIEAEDYIVRAYNMLYYHIFLLAVGIGLVVLLPLYSRLLGRINTSIDVEGNEGTMGAIELSGDE